MADDNSQDQQDQTPPPATDDNNGLGDAGKKALDAMKAERNQARSELNALRKELDQFKQAQMSESEKAVAEAEQRGRATATTEFGQRLAAAQFVAQAAKRNPDFDAAGVLEDLNLGKYVTETGEPDINGLVTVVERLVPERAGNPRPSGDAYLGPRASALPLTDGSAKSLIAAGIAHADAAKH